MEDGPNLCGFISEGILTLVTVPTKGAKSCPFSAQGRNLAHFVGNGTNVKIRKAQNEHCLSKFE